MRTTGGAVVRRLHRGHGTGRRGRHSRRPLRLRRGNGGEGSGGHGNRAQLPPASAPLVPEQRPAGPEPGDFAPGADAAWPAGSPPMRRDERGFGAPARGPAPWDPPSTRPTGPVTFPSGPRPPGFPAPPPTPPPRRSRGGPGFPSAHRRPARRPRRHRPWSRRSRPPRPTARPPPPGTADAASPAARTRTSPAVGYVGSGPPTYDAEPTALPLADPDASTTWSPTRCWRGAVRDLGPARRLGARDSARFRANRAGTPC